MAGKRLLSVVVADELSVLLRSGRPRASALACPTADSTRWRRSAARWHFNGLPFASATHALSQMQEFAVEAGHRSRHRPRT